MNLPLIDGHFLIDNSALEQLKCPQAFFYNQILARVPTSEAAGRNFGSTIHRGLEIRYHTKDLNQAKTAMQEWLTANPQPEGDFRNFNHACLVLDTYDQIYRKESFEILHTHAGKFIIEASFALPFGKVDNIPILYCGKIDLGIRDNLGIWSFDHKTAFQFGDTFTKQMSMDGGQRGYCWALKQVTGQQPKGYVIDAIRIRRPKRGDEFRDIAPCDATDFQRLRFQLTESELNEWQEDVLAMLENIFFMAKRDKWPRQRWQCVGKYGLCDYFDVCGSLPQHREQILNSGLFQDNVWTKGLKTESEKQ